MSEVVYRPYFFMSQSWNSWTPVNWWIDEGVYVTVGNERMVRFGDTITPEANGGWFKSKEEALKHIANEVRQHAAKLIEKAEEIES